MFLNFITFPTIAIGLGIAMPQTDVVISEEENVHSSSVIFYEKVLPKTLNIHDFIKFFEQNLTHEIYSLHDNGKYVQPHISVISPPPEV